MLSVLKGVYFLPPWGGGGLVYGHIYFKTIHLKTQIKLQTQLEKKHKTVASDTMKSMKAKY